MRFQHTSRRTLLLPAVAAAIALLLAACGENSSAQPRTFGSGKHPGASAASSAEAQIKANWEAFFAPSTPTSKRVSLLQNGSQFASVISAQSKSSLASTASATVNSVKVVSDTQADVVYSIDVGGTPELSNQKGVAVNQGGTWKVGDSSFCALLALENGGSTSGLPAACKSAS